MIQASYASTCSGTRPAAGVASEEPQGFFPTYRYCDWPKDQRLTDRRLDQLVGLLSSPRTSMLAMSVRQDSPLLRHRSWRNVEKSCLVLKEEEITQHTLPKYLAYLDATTDLATSGCFSQQESFQQHFEDVRRGAKISLEELMRRFDEVVLTESDPYSNLVEPPDEENTSFGRRAELLRVLRGLVEDGESSNLIELGRIMERRRAQGRSCIRRQIELYEKSADLLTPSGKRPGNSEAARSQLLSSLLWCAMLFASDSKLWRSPANGRRTPELFTVAVDQLARDFLERSLTRDADPLFGLWPLIRSSLKHATMNLERGLPRARRHLVAAMCDAKSCRAVSDGDEWTARLAGLVSEAATAIDAQKNLQKEGR